MFEIFPQRATAELAKIAELVLDLQEEEDLTYSLNGNRAIIYDREKGTVIVWDFIANTVASWTIHDVGYGDEVCYIFFFAMLLQATDHPPIYKRLSKSRKRPSYSFAMNPCGYSRFLL